METIAEAKEFLKQNLERGCECPCCTHHVKLYRRKLTSAMAYAIILISKHRTGYFHVEDYLKSLNCPSSIRGDFAKLRFFGLITGDAAERDDGSSRNGLYCITHQGIDFVEGRVSVEAAVYIFKNKVYRKDPQTINIMSALGKKFNYKELMA